MVLKKITCTWYRKVSTIMQSEPSLQKRLSKTTVSVGTPDQQFEEFAPEVVSVTDTIHAAGKDVNTMTRQEIVHVATDMLVLHRNTLVPVVQDAPAVSVAEVSRSAEKPVAVPQAEAKPINANQTTVAPSSEAPVKRKRGRPRKIPVEVSAARPAPVATPAPVQTEATSRPTLIQVDPEPEPIVDDEPVAPVKPTEKAAPVLEEESEAATEAKSPAKEPAAFKSIKPKGVQKNGAPSIDYVRPNIPYVPAVAICSNLQAVLTVLEPYATDPDAREIMDRVSQLLDNVHKKSVIPVIPTNA